MPASSLPHGVSGAGTFTSSDDDAIPGPGTRQERVISGASRRPSNPSRKHPPASEAVGMASALPHPTPHRCNRETPEWQRRPAALSWPPLVSGAGRCYCVIRVRSSHFRNNIRTAVLQRARGNGLKRERFCEADVEVRLEPSAPRVAVRHLHCFAKIAIVMQSGSENRIPTAGIAPRTDAPRMGVTENRRVRIRH